MAVAPLSDGVRNSNEIKTRMVVTLALILTFSPREKEQRSHLSGFADNRPANPIAGDSKDAANGKALSVGRGFG